MKQSYIDIQYHDVSLYIYRYIEAEDILHHTHDSDYNEINRDICNHNI